MRSIFPRIIPILGQDIGIKNIFKGKKPYRLTNAGFYPQNTLKLFTFSFFCYLNVTGISILLNCLSVTIYESETGEGRKCFI